MEKKLAMHEMRRKDRQLSAETTEQILKNGEYGILSTVGADGIPYGVPVNYAYADNCLYFHCAKGVGLKVANMVHQNKVCFTVVGSTEVLPGEFSTKYESAIVFGTVREATDKRIGLTLLQEKYSPEYAQSGRELIAAYFEQVAVYEMVIEELTGKGRR